MIGLITPIFFLLSVNFVASDDFYEACSPKECGGINITSPFHVAGHQPSYCGYLGFQVSCEHNLPLFNISGDSYIIKHISYTNQTLRIVNSAFSTSTFGCISLTNSVHKLSIINNPSLEYTSKPREIVLLQDCSTKAMKGMSNYTNIICKSNSHRNASFSLVGVYDRDLKWKGVDGECRWSVLVPYEDSGANKVEDQIRAGFTLKWTNGARCHSCQTSGGRCVYNLTTMEFRCSCLNGSDEDEYCKFYGNGWKWLIAGEVIGSMLLLSAVCLPFVACIAAVISGVKHAFSRRQRARGNRNIEDFIRNQESNSPKRYNYKQIKKMTNSFKDKLGEGGYSVVYKGKLLDGRIVAVKLLKKSVRDGEDFINEVASISSTNHVNVVTLLRFCFEGRRRCLVYEFMPNGSLEKFKRAKTENSESLSWETLFQIALGIARGLEYLHKGCKTRILHFDIKPHNILLGENFCPKISDFGLAKSCPQTDQSRISMSLARGTIGYIAPEVYCRNFGEVSHKSDVYSYGMMVLEVIGCRENPNDNGDTSGNEYFPDWIYKQLNRETDVEGGEEMGLKRKMMLVSLWCIQTIPSSRPSMDRVVQMLEGSLGSIEVPSIPTFSSPPRAHADTSGSSTMTNDSFSGGHNEIPSSVARGLRVCLSFPPEPQSLVFESKSTRNTR